VLISTFLLIGERGEFKLSITNRVGGVIHSTFLSAKQH